jgi:hypothetical protein
MNLFSVNELFFVFILFFVSGPVIAQKKIVSPNFANGRINAPVYDDLNFEVVVYSASYNLGGYQIISPRIKNKSNKKLVIEFELAIHNTCNGPVQKKRFKETVLPFKSKGGNTTPGSYQLFIDYSSPGCKNFLKYTYGQRTLKSIWSGVEFAIIKVSYENPS